MANTPDYSNYTGRVVDGVYSKIRRAAQDAGDRDFSKAPMTRKRKRLAAARQNFGGGGVVQYARDGSSRSDMRGDYAGKRKARRGGKKRSSKGRGSSSR